MSLYTKPIHPLVWNLSFKQSKRKPLIQTLLCTKSNITLDWYQNFEQSKTKCFHGLHFVQRLAKDQNFKLHRHYPLLWNSSSENRVKMVFSESVPIRIWLWVETLTTHLPALYPLGPSVSTSLTQEPSWYLNHRNWASLRTGLLLTCYKGWNDIEALSRSRLGQGWEQAKA